MRVLAVDLGATSVRVVAVVLGDGAPSVEVLHRHNHRPRRHGDGSLRWDWSRIVAEVEIGLHKGVDAGPVDSIGIDAWGVDYGLIDEGGGLVAAPFSYRSDRSQGWGEIATRIGPDLLYRTTGIQLMGINTIFQLAVHDPAELEAARHLLMLPELLVYLLTGARSAERTTAGTTGLVDIATGDWSLGLLSAIGVDRSLFSSIQPAGTQVGYWKEIPIHLVGGHDTASAIAAAPLDPSGSSAFISSGTWMLVGAECDEPLLSTEAQSRNFSNEPSTGPGVRLLKNVMGHWMFDEICRQGNLDRSALTSAAGELGPNGPIVDATDERFLAPPDMATEVRAAAGLNPHVAQAVVARCVLDSLAAAAASVVTELTDVTGRPFSEVVVVGGGVRNRVLNQLISAATGLIVKQGPVEASALGNALAQGVALGVYSDLSEARLLMRSDR